MIFGILEDSPQRGYPSQARRWKLAEVFLVKKVGTDWLHNCSYNNENQNNCLWLVEVRMAEMWADLLGMSMVFVCWGKCSKNGRTEAWLRRSGVFGGSYIFLLFFLWLIPHNNTRGASRGCTILFWRSSPLSILQFMSGSEPSGHPQRVVGTLVYNHELLTKNDGYYGNPIYMLFDIGIYEW